MNGDKKKIKFYTKDHLIGARFDIGDFTYGKPEILTWGEETKLIIGKFTSIADGVKIFLGGEHRTDWVTTYPFPVLETYWPEAAKIKGHPKTKGDVIIGNDVWIGGDATILSGVKIGDGAVIGAGAVISKDVPPYAIVAGNPGVIVKYRFKKSIIKKLLKLQWWEWPTKKIRENVDILCSNNFKELI